MLEILCCIFFADTRLSKRHLVAIGGVLASENRPQRCSIKVLTAGESSARRSTSMDQWSVGSEEGIDSIDAQRVNSPDAKDSLEWAASMNRIVTNFVANTTTTLHPHHPMYCYSDNDGKCVWSWNILWQNAFSAIKGLLRSLNMRIKKDFIIFQVG